jgi:hypothetical protein
VRTSSLNLDLVANPFKSSSESASARLENRRSEVNRIQAQAAQTDRNSDEIASATT